MSILTIKDFLVLNKGSQTLKRQFDNHCNWCWGHDEGNCNLCRKRFMKYYLPMRIAEKQKELGLKVTR